MSPARTLSFLLGALSLSVVPGCYDNVGTMFPAGFGPWETPNLASVPAATATDACPETLHLVTAPMYMGASDVHAAACIHAPMAMVWQAIQDPETGHDPSSTNSFAVIRPPNASECDGAFESMINAGGAPFSVDFRLCWRHRLVTGTDAAPVLTATRWQKVWGTSAIRRLEGSLVAQPFIGDPDHITAVYYQYHLNAVTTGPSNVETINAYLSVIYDRLRQRSHGTML